MFFSGLKYLSLPDVNENTKLSGKNEEKKSQSHFFMLRALEKKKKELSSKISDKTLGCGHLTTGGEDSSTAILFNNETGSTIINH